MIVCFDKIPFSLQYASALLPAGQYTVNSGHPLNTSYPALPYKAVADVSSRTDPGT